MAITTFAQWSATAALNIDLNSIPLDGAVMLASQVDDAFREMMAQLVANVGTTAQFWANTSGKHLTTDKVWAGAVPATLTDAATIAVDFGALINGAVVLAGNRTLGAPSNTKNGQAGCISIQQDGTGSRTLAYHANWKFEGGTAPVLSTTASAIDLLFYTVLSSSFIFGTLVRGVA